MVKRLYYPLFALILLFSSILGLMVKFRQTEVPLLYLSDFNTKDEVYTVLDVETGETLNFHRPAGFRGIQYGGELPPTRRDYTSPYDDSVRFVLIHDYNTSNYDETEKFYRVDSNNQLVVVLFSGTIYISNFTDDQHYLYFYTSGDMSRSSDFYALYRYDIQSTELSLILANTLSPSLYCQEQWCLISTQKSPDESETQTLLALNINSGEIREIADAEKFTNRIWWRPNEVLYTTYHGDGQAIIHTYNIETAQYRTLATFEEQEIVSVQASAENNQSEDWLKIITHPLEDDSIFDIYIINHLDDAPVVHPLGIQSIYRWVPHMTTLSGSLLLSTYVADPNNRTNNLYIIDDVLDNPTLEQLTSDDFNTTSLENVELTHNLGDTVLVRMPINETEWAYFAVHVPTRTITQQAVFNKKQSIVETLLSDDKKQLAVSMQEEDKFYVVIVPLDGSQAVQKWDIGTESYVCLLAWYEKDVAPRACRLYFGMG